MLSFISEINSVASLTICSARFNRKCTAGCAKAPNIKMFRFTNQTILWIHSSQPSYSTFLATKPSTETTIPVLYMQINQPAIIAAYFPSISKVFEARVANHTLFLVKCSAADRSLVAAKAITKNAVFFIFCHFLTLNFIDRPIFDRTKWTKGPTS
jgi:hypothetical protein